MSEALSVEVKEHIDVMSMHPGLVSSNMCKLPPGGQCASIEDTVSACLKNLGHDSVSIGVWRHEWEMKKLINNPCALMNEWAVYFKDLEAKEK